MRDGQAGRTSTWREPHAEHFISAPRFAPSQGNQGAQPIPQTENNDA
jgi:hypothetical protein